MRNKKIGRPLSTHSNTKKKPLLMKVVEKAVKPPRDPKPSPVDPNHDAVTNYAKAVTAGLIIAGPYVRAACQRHLNDLKNAHERGFFFDVAAAQRIIGYYRDVLRLSEGQFEDTPFILQPPQEFIAGSIMGWKRIKDGTRRFRRAYIEQGKGNGKSPFVGGLGLFGLASDGEPGAEIYSAGAKKEQAAILFRDAVKMVHKSETVQDHVGLDGGLNPYGMHAKRGGGFFRPISREAGKTGSGPRPHYALIDELHEHPNRSVMELLERGFKFRRQPLLIMITNSGTDRNSVCYEEHSHAIKVATGEVEDDTTFSYVCALDEDDDPLNDPTCWVKANPLLGTILTEEYLQGVVNQAKAIPGKLNGILRLHFCCWTDSDRAWLTRAHIESVEDPKMKMEDFLEKTCWVGLDLAATNDLAGVTFVFEDGYTEDHKPKFAMFARGFTPEDTLAARALRDKAPYEAWVEAGNLITTPGTKIRLEYIAHYLVEAGTRYNIEEIVYDKYLIREFENHLDDLGSTFKLLEHPQGFNFRKDNDLFMPDSIESFEILIAENRIRLEVNPALRSAIAGATFRTSPAGLRRFEKINATQRIDLIVAGVQAVGAAVKRVKANDTKYQLLIL